MEDFNVIKSRVPTFHGTDAAYLLPNDLPEHKRLDSQHRALVALTEDRVTHVPDCYPSTIIDIGCGTGVVTRHLSDIYSDAKHVYGIDLSPVPTIESDAIRRPNLTFVQGDIHNLVTDDTRFTAGCADLIFNRLLICGISDWPRYIRSVMMLLKPGAWVEMQDFTEDFYCEEPARCVPRHDWQWLKIIRQALVHKKLDPDAGAHIHQHMLDAGFVDVSVKEFKIPHSRTSSVHPLVAKQYIGDPWGHHWGLIRRLGEEQGLDDDCVLKLQDEMKECLKIEGIGQTYYVITGRKPES